MSASAAEVLLGKLKKVTSTDDSSWLARCPAHDDRNPSLSVRETEAGVVLLHCFAGCATADVLKAVDLSMAALMPKGGARYEYHVRDHGELVTLKTVERRWDPRRGAKTFRQRGDTKRHALFNLVAVEQAATAGLEVWVVEGEKDAQALELLGVVATTIDGGSSSPGKADLSPLKGAELVIVRDRDKAGKVWQEKLLRALAPVGGVASRVVALARPPKGFHDAGDAVAANISRDAFKRRRVRISVWDHALQVDDADRRPAVVDVAVALSGGLEVPVPSLGSRRTDDHQLLYRSAVNVLFGPPEGGKTLIAIAHAIDVLRGGGLVLHLDLDHNGVAGIIGRYRALGAPLDRLSDPSRFRLVMPETREEYLVHVSDALAFPPDLVVVDSIGELLPMFGGDSNSADEYSAVHRAALTSFAATGAGVLALDHVSKGAGRSLSEGATGSHAKKRAVDGVMLRVGVIEAFAPGSGGAASLSIAKDRHGGVREYSPTGGEGQEPIAAVFRLEYEPSGRAHWTLHPGRLADDRLDADVAALSRLVPPPTSKTDVKARMRWGTDRALAALQEWRDRGGAKGGESDGVKLPTFPISGPGEGAAEDRSQDRSTNDRSSKAGTAKSAESRGKTGDGPSGPMPVPDREARSGPAVPPPYRGGPGTEGQADSAASCRICGTSLLHPESVSRGVCAKRDEDHLLALGGNHG
ncbi:AAA family ATPase [Microbacterium sp.]|uniref:AAA family ATPase n=1 Tax=Microbacterium sp. TaxID=51671 RepID=UPI003F991FF7